MIDRFEVSGSLAGERLDRALGLITGHPRSEIARLITEGKVQISGSVITVRHRKVAVGEWLEIELAVPEELSPVPLANDQVPFTVVYEDDALLVVDKPAGVVVHPGAGHRDDTLVSGLLASYPELAERFSDGEESSARPGIVHRLDKDTSGLLVVARTPAAHRSLTAQLVERRMGRTYLALARGNVRAEEGIIEAPIARNPRDPTKMAVRSGGREARTRYRVLRRFDDPAELTYLEVQLDTGRTHQIRVHLQAIEHPVAGDPRYGGAVRGLELRRPFLHAAKLVLEHPSTGEELVVTSALPADLQAVLDRCI